MKRPSKASEPTLPDSNVQLGDAIHCCLNTKPSARKTAFPDLGPNPEPNFDQPESLQVASIRGGRGGSVALSLKLSYHPLVVLFGVPHPQIPKRLRPKTRMCRFKTLSPEELCCLYSFSMLTSSAALRGLAITARLAQMQPKTLNPNCLNPMRQHLFDPVAPLEGSFPRPKSPGPQDGLWAVRGSGQFRVWTFEDPFRPRSAVREKRDPQACSVGLSRTFHCRAPPKRRDPTLGSIGQDVPSIAFRNCFLPI